MPPARVADGGSYAKSNVSSSTVCLNEAELTPLKQQQQQAHSGSGAIVGVDGKPVVEMERFKQLDEYRERLEDQLIRKIEELKRVCIDEGEITGTLPTEIYKTLMPGEVEPKVKRRIGTAFKFSDEIFHGIKNPDDRTGQLEADIELHRKIVAAAERLAKDKTTNKSVRKKRRKDWQAASQRLRGLEKGLYKMRISNSKPDVSLHFDNTSMSNCNAGSGFSLNNLKTWPNIAFSLRNSAKSCPSTPRGSVPDLSVEGDDRKAVPTMRDSQHQQMSFDMVPQCVANTSSGRLVRGGEATSISRCHSPSPSFSSELPATNSYPPNKVLVNPKLFHPHTPDAVGPSEVSSCSASDLPPAIPNRARYQHASQASLTNKDRSQRSHIDNGDGGCDGGIDQCDDYSGESPLYANVGYTSSVPYKSAYRQFNFPTLQDSKHSGTYLKLNEINKSTSSSSTCFSVKKADDAATAPLPSSRSATAIISTEMVPFVLRQHLGVGNASTLQRCSATSQCSAGSLSIGSLSMSSSLSSTSSTSNAAISTATSGYQSSAANSSSSLQQQQLINHHFPTTEKQLQRKPANPHLLSRKQQQYSSTSLDRRMLNANNRNVSGNAVIQEESQQSLAGFHAVDGGGSGHSGVTGDAIFNRFLNNQQLREKQQLQKQQHLSVQQPLITTFPISDYCRPLETSDFTRIRSASTARIVPISVDQAIVPPGSGASTLKKSSVSASALPPAARSWQQRENVTIGSRQATTGGSSSSSFSGFSSATDPLMEALLATIHSRNEKPAKTGSKTSTMV